MPSFFFKNNFTVWSEQRTEFILTRSGNSLKIKFIHSFIMLQSEGRQCKDCFFHNLTLHSILSSSEHLYRLVYIYIYAFSRLFYPKRLTVHSGYTFFSQYVCSLGIEPTTFCADNTMLYHWATGTQFGFCVDLRVRHSRKHYMHESKQFA